MLKLAGSLNRYPARITSTGFALLILAGTLLLLLPGVKASGREPISFLDALFMSTSSVCVTGLSVRSLATDFSVFGQMLIALLVQVGGLGIMTLTTFVLLAVGVRGGLRQQLVINSTIAGESKADLKVILKRVLWFTITCESIGAMLLFVKFLTYGMGIGKALWNAIFLSIAAFCNAGFALDDRNLIPFQDDTVVLSTIMLLIVVGGLGYPVVFDIASCMNRFGRRWWDELHIHSKLMLLGTTVLILGGFTAILYLEWNNPQSEDRTTYEKILSAMFQSITSRTAGFNSVDLTKYGNATLIVIMVLMMIGAGPCSTAGGMKVSTIMMVALHALAKFRSQDKVTVYRRTIPQAAIDRAIATTMLFSIVALVGMIAVLAIEEVGTSEDGQRREFLQIAFEAISALGTVGLSINDTWNLLPASKIVIIILMFVGRLGPIVFFSALSTAPKRITLQYASEEPITG